MKKRTVITREGSQVDSYKITYDGKEYSYKIQDPTFDQLSAALTESVGMTGRLNMSGGGKVIWELCCTEASEEIEKIPKILLSVCLDIYSEYVLPADNEIKKN